MASLLPTLRQRFTDANGEPLAGGKVWSYEAGTTTPVATFTDQSGATPNTNPIILDASGEADIWIGPGYFKLVIMDADDVVLKTVDNVSLPGSSSTAVPTGGLTGQVLTKLGDGDFMMVWADASGGVEDAAFTRSGYSSRFNQLFTSISAADFVDKVLLLTYAPPTISLGATGLGLREKGSPVTATTLSANVVKVLNDISVVRFYKDGALLATQTSGGAIPNGGTNSYAWTGSFSDNATFSAQAADVAGGGGGPTTVSASQTFQFVYPYYVGAASAGLSAAGVASLTKLVIASNANLVRSITAAGGNVFYFAYPVSHGALASILDVNNFETLGDWTLRTENITGLDGSPVSYRIYEFKNPVVAGSYQYTFKR